MTNKFKLICNTCGSEAEIMAYRRLDVRRLLITYVCPACGESQQGTVFMYEENQCTLYHV